MDKVEAKIIEIIESRKEEIIGFGRDIWSHGELGYREFRTSEKFAAALRACGVDQVEEHLAVTGVKGTLRAKEPKASIAIMGEMDALYMPDHPGANPETKAAHACGHHAQITAVIGAAMALADPEIRKELEGSVSFIGVPAEESIASDYYEKIRDEGLVEYAGGKCEMLSKGCLRDIELMIGHHIGGQGIRVSFGSCNGFVNKYVTFHGRSAHSFGAGHRGLDAMAAANIAQHALALQQETFRDQDHVKIHGFVSEAGKANNIIADRVSLEYTVRGGNTAAIEDASKKFDRAMKAGASAFGCGVTIRTTPGYLPIYCLKDKEVIIRAAREVGAVTGYEVEVDRSFSHGGGSTDYGDITAVMPLLYVETGGCAGDGHSNDYHPADEYQAYVVPAMVFALTAYNLVRCQAAEARRLIDSYDRPLSQEEYRRYLDSNKSVFSMEPAPLPLLDQ